jgi:hypothetical protein
LNSALENNLKWNITILVLISNIYGFLVLKKMVIL